jgi:hypothetical protein
MRAQGNKIVVCAQICQLVGHNNLTPTTDWFFEVEYKVLGNSFNITANGNQTLVSLGLIFVLYFINSFPPPHQSVLYIADINDVAAESSEKAKSLLSMN